MGTHRTLLLACLMILPLSASAQLHYSLGADWSEISNPNGPWSLREGSNLLPHVSAWQSTIGGWSVAQPAWSRSENGTNRLPAWLMSNGSESLVHDWLAGDIVVHSTDGLNGIGNGPASVVWTSPAGGAATVTGHVWIGRDIGRAVVWSVTINGGAVTSGQISSGDPYDRAAPFDLQAGSGGAAVLQDIPVMPGTAIALRLDTPQDPGDFVGVVFDIDFNGIVPARPSTWSRIKSMYK